MTTYIVERYLKEGGRRVCVVVATTDKEAISIAAKHFGASDDWDVTFTRDGKPAGLLWSSIIKH